MRWITLKISERKRLANAMVRYEIHSHMRLDPYRNDAVGR
jgi:hypothetical protein